MKVRFYNDYTGQVADRILAHPRVTIDHLWDRRSGGPELVAVYREVDGSENGSSNLDGWYLNSDGARFTDWWFMEEDA